MIFIGNDIVSLNDPMNISGFSSEKYLNKVFISQELDFISIYCNNITAAAMIWSCKESAYKILIKKGLRKAFSPRYYHWQQSGNNTIKEQKKIKGIIIYEKCCYYTISEINSDFIFTVACENQDMLSKIKSYIKKIEPNQTISQSILTNQLAIDTVSKLTKIGIFKLKIIKKNGMPVIYSNDVPLKTEISLSHDFDYIACSIII